MSAATSSLAADAVAGVTDPMLRGVVADHWDHMMRWAPTWATTLGDHRFDDRLAPRDEAAIDAMWAEHDALLARIRAIDAGALGDTDAVTCKLLRGRLEAERAVGTFKLHEHQLVDSGTSTVFDELSYLIELHVVRTADDARNVVARMRQGAKLFDDKIASLERGLATGRVTSVARARRVLEQLDAELGKPVETWAMASPAWAAREPASHAELRDVVARDIYPAVVRMRDFVRDRLLAHARGDDEGLGALPDGDAAYRATILFHVGLPLEPRVLHELGLAEIERTDRELAELGRRVLGAPDRAATIAKLRDDRTLYFTSKGEILAAAQAALDRAKAALPRFFAVLPRTDCVMREIPDYEAPYSTIAYYRQPHYDGTKPGEYFVNTYRPESRPRYELEALTWHESIPGHHLQIALAQELGALPAFRKLDGSTAFVEGWALYTESLADEMGLYSSDLDRLGRISYDAWRACRLVVDTGIHALGWTRAQAEAYMREHTALTPINIANEVDRYIGWPGQALAYKVGQLEILRLRREAEGQLGTRFDLPAFHAIVLGAGAVTLPVLADRVTAWIETVLS
ncbi:MAG TPA: DUF885 domain-containing protein [Kofleriaceae bacterium]|nr:DUF885 domain-containing protein [Kofleriaceae bacterium]